MSDSPYRESGATTEPTHCLFCGEERLPDGSCRKCLAWSGASLEDDTPDAGFPCPRCKTTFLRVDSIGRAKVKICDGCHGLFVPALQFSFLLNDYLAGIELPIGTLVPLPPRRRGEMDPKLDNVVCIGCRREMDRVEFAARSGAIVDVCNVHGIWLDAGELVPILHFVRTRAELGEVPLSDEERADAELMARERERSALRMASIAAFERLLNFQRDDDS